MTYRRMMALACMLVATHALSGCGSQSSDENEGGGGSGLAADGGAADPLGRDKATAEKGAEAVKKRKCVDCHGANMAGMTTPLGQDDARVELYPPNLTPDVETGLGDPSNPDPATKGYTDELLARAIRSGLDRDDLTLCPQMRHYSEMSDFEVYSIVKYLRSIPAVKNKVPRSVCPPLKTKEEQAAASAR